MKAISREKQEEEMKVQEETNSRHATRHQVAPVVPLFQSIVKQKIKCNVIQSDYG